MYVTRTVRTSRKQEVTFDDGQGRVYRESPTRGWVAAEGDRYESTPLGTPARTPSAPPEIGSRRVNGVVVNTRPAKAPPITASNSRWLGTGDGARATRATCTFLVTYGIGSCIDLNLYRSADGTGIKVHFDTQAKVGELESSLAGGDHLDDAWEATVVGGNGMAASNAIFTAVMAVLRARDVRIRETNVGHWDRPVSTALDLRTGEVTDASEARPPDELLAQRRSSRLRFRNFV